MNENTTWIIAAAAALLVGACAVQTIKPSAEQRRALTPTWQLKIEGYKRAFDPPDRKVLVVIAAERSASVGEPTSAAEGLGVGAVASIGAAFSIVYVPFIPWILYSSAKEGADTAKFLDANPDWQRKL